MTRTANRASYVQLSPNGRTLYAVYPRGVQPADIQSVADQLAVTQDVAARATKGALDEPTSRPVTILEVAIGQAANRDYALRLLKRLTNPELPIGIYELRFGLLLCKCNYLSSTIDGLRFIQGFEPDDVESFRLQFYAALKLIPIASLFSSAPSPPYADVMDALEAMLLGLGARATILEVQPRRDPRLCTHVR